jgi:hypothetical protein
MTIQYIGERIFLEEVEASQLVWVLRNVHNSIYTNQYEKAGFSLPVWSSQDKASAFLKNARLIGPKYEPHSVPLDTFANAWLSDQMKAIIELLINPDGKSSRMLALTTEEFQESQGVT